MIWYLHVHVSDALNWTLFVEKKNLDIILIEIVVCEFFKMISGQNSKLNQSSNT